MPYFVETVQPSTKGKRLLEVISFEASERNGEKIIIDKKYVEKQLAKLVQDEDLSRYIL